MLSYWSLTSIIHDLPVGYSEVIYNDKVYALIKEIFNQGKSTKIYAHELWWEDYISCNRYETKTDNYLRPCEMSVWKVVDFLSRSTPYSDKSLYLTIPDMYMPDTENQKTIIIWLGCFRWIQAMFDEVNWVLATEVWYAWWSTLLPNYGAISDYTEAVKVIYNPYIISLEDLFDIIAQYKDLGFQSQKRQYKYAIRYRTEDEKILLIQKKDKLQQQSERSILLEILPHTHFERAEEYHQKYFFKHNLSKTWAVC